MIRRTLYILLIIITTIPLNACNNINLDKEVTSDTSTNPTMAISPTPSFQYQNILTKQLLEEAKMPIGIYGKFVTAIHGDKKSQEWIDKNYDDNKYFSFFDAVFPYSDVKKAYQENECYYNIGILYYYGNKGIPVKQNREKAFYWLNLSADEGSSSGAIMAGDMAQNGDGIFINEKIAFDLYKKALDNEVNDIAYERLAYCYESGIGTNIDKQKAKEYYFKSALYGNENGLYKLSNFCNLSPMQSLLLLKAAGSMDYSTDYFDMVYGGLDGYSPDELKLKLNKQLTEVWGNGTDEVSEQLKTTIRENKYFPKQFVEELIKTSYTYSYHAFAKKYGMKTNCSYKDGKKVKFDLSDDNKEFDNYNMPKKYLEDDECEFYKLDFDGDGEDEIGMPLLSGAGGAFMADSFGIFKKNKKGLYEEYAGGPNCTLRDAMRLIKYDGRIYFITNPFSDTMNAPHNIIAYVIDKDGKGHELSVNCNEYKPKEIMRQVYGNYNTEDFKCFISNVMTHAYKAISATKRHEMYNPNATKQLSKQPKDIFSVSSFKDVYYEADINNDNAKEFIRKGHMITQDKYYNDRNVFQIYYIDPKLLKNTKSLLDILPNDDYYGLHSSGNIYDLLPIGGKIVQFWTHEHDSKTYCIALTRNELLYAVHIYTIQNNKPIPVCDSLLFDEVQNIDTILS